VDHLLPSPMHALPPAAAWWCRRTGSGGTQERLTLEALRAAAPTSTDDKAHYATVTGGCLAVLRGASHLGLTGCMSAHAHNYAGVHSARLSLCSSDWECIRSHPAVSLCCPAATFAMINPEQSLYYMANPENNRKVRKALRRARAARNHHNVRGRATAKQGLQRGWHGLQFACKAL